MFQIDYKQIVIAVLAIAVGVQTMRLSREVSAHLKTKKTHAEALKDLSEKTTKAHQAVAAFTASVSRTLAEKDQQHTKELNHAKTENDRLRTAARSGSASVRIQGYNCAASASAVPAATFASSLGNGRTEVAGELRENIFDHRAAVIAAQTQIKYLQDYARICQQEPEVAK